MIKRQPLKVIGIIPSRYGSTRFPGKPLAIIQGKTLIQRTYERACLSSTLDALVVATDDQRIFDHVIEFGGEAIMTSKNCATGSDRTAEVVKNNRQFHDSTFIVNIQGDEPCLEPEVIDRIVEALENAPEAVMSTAVAKLTSPGEAADPSVVKCVLDRNFNALYFSRALIPAGKEPKFRPDLAYYRHLGIFAFRREFLQHYTELDPTPLQLAEDLEQLKVIEYGYQIKVAIVESCSVHVDIPEDIKKVENFLCKQNSFSFPEESVHP